MPAGTVLFTSGGASPKLVVTLESARVTRDPAMARAMEARANRCLLAGRDDCGWLERMTTRAAQRWSADPGPAQMAFVRHALNVAPDEVFLMLPVYAAIVALVYRDRRQRFGDHLVFGLHLHAFWFFAAALALVLPRAGVEAVVVFVTWHALVSLHEVYGGSWPRAGLRGIGISVAYLGVFALVTGAASFCLFVS